MFGLKSIPTTQLVALRFSDYSCFREAARLAAEKKLPVEVPGHQTLIVRKSDRVLFADKHLKFDEEAITNPEAVPPEERSMLRRLFFRGV